MAHKPHQNVGDGWTGWVEVTDLGIERVNGNIEATSRHRMSAKNDGNQDGNFRVTYNMEVQTWISADPNGDRNDDRNWGSFDSDVQTEDIPCDAGKTVGHSILEDDYDMPHVRSTSKRGPGGRPWRVVAYTQVDPQHPITGATEKVDEKKVVEL